MAKSGTTAVCILWHQTEKMLYSAWVGDSEAILVKKGHIFRLVEPHKANRTVIYFYINKENLYSNWNLFLNVIYNYFILFFF